jgi:hypothetical protein
MNILSKNQQEVFIDAFMEAATWSSLHTFKDEEGNEQTVEMDSVSTDWTEESAKIAEEGCKAFIAANSELLSNDLIEAWQAGHDLWLTSQGHGAGFWDRGYPKSLGDGLTEAAKDFKHKAVGDLFVNEDKKVSYEHT